MRDVINILMDSGQKAFAPGDSLSGTIEWTADGRPAGLRVRLLWQLISTNSLQIGIVEEQFFKSPGPQGNQGFSFKLPDGPWSFAGQHMGLDWAVEVTLLPSRANAVANFQVVPGRGNLIWIGEKRHF